MRFLSSLLIYLISFFFLPQKVFAQQQILNLYAAEDHRPFINQSGQKQGFFTDITKALLKDTELEAQWNFLPWARAQATAQTNNKAIILNIARTASREDKYRWLLKIMETDYVLITLTAPVDSLEQARFCKIVVLRGTPRAKQLEQAGFENYILADSPAEAARLLKTGRADTWYTVSHRAAYVWTELGHDVQELKFGEPTQTVDLWIATNRDYIGFRSLQRRLAQSFNKLQQSGMFDQVIQDYVGPIPRLGMPH